MAEYDFQTEQLRQWFGGGSGPTLPERIASIEAHMKHMATRAWVLGGVVGGMVAATLVTLAVIRLFFNVTT
ncbi:MAG: hypothetical protein OXM56_11095 [Gammaproteobacteria bacterium]|nr:hypothetical protein [Gammaproteobacteria bacterium]